MFDTVLIANRGEIACRVIRTLRALGIRSVAVFTPPDAAARHVTMADVAVAIGGYLDGDAIIAAARRTGAEAIHPGYGFLAENAPFAAACAAAGVVFIGPSPAAIEVMGDKIAAKTHVAARGVPVVPGLARPGLSDAELVEAVREVGFPALLKPSAGGGGKGMHVVTDPGEVASAIATARREAAASFGDDTLFVERYVTRPRHIEVQVLADAHGRTLALGERECTLQRRHQKVVEEAPSPLLDADTRERIGRDACETARSVGYTGAGTVEFIVSDEAPGEYFFMEMNTRLQVEHPVTELVTGIDLVEQQLRVAAGEPLAIRQADVALTGHAVEARVYAEDPAAGFLPTGGRVLALEEPEGDGVRVDSALLPGLVVTADYDPMLAKVIAWAPDRAEALARLRRALTGTAVLGVTTNVPFLIRLLEDGDVGAGNLDTGLIERRLDTLAAPAPLPDAEIAGALITLATEARPAGAWGAVPGWRIGGASPAVVDFGDRAVAVLGPADDALVTVGDAPPVRCAVRLAGPAAQVRIGDVVRRIVWARDGDDLHLAGDGAQVVLRERRASRAAAEATGEAPELRSPMPGTVVALAAEDGASVAVGDPVVVVEAMKMEHAVRAAVAGTVELRVSVGDAVARDELLASIRTTAEREGAG